MPTATSTGDHRIGFGAQTALALLGFAVLYAYGTTLLSLVQQWHTNDTYAHGFLIPLISAWIVWVRRDRLKTVVPMPSMAAGAAALVASLALFVISTLAAVSVVAQLSFVLTLAGLILLVWGGGVFRVLWLPLAYLLFMIPVVRQHRD